MPKEYNISDMPFDEVELSVDSYNPYDPSEPPQFEPSKQEPLPNLSTDEIMFGRIDEKPQALSSDEVFLAPELFTLDSAVDIAGKTAKLTGKVAWKTLGILSWPFVRIEAGLATPTTAILRTVGPLVRPALKEVISDTLFGPTEWNKTAVKNMIRDGLTPYARDILGKNLEPMLDDFSEQILAGEISQEEFDEAMGEAKAALPEILPAFYHGAKSFIPFTRNDPEKVKNFNDMWAAYYETLTGEPEAPESLKQVAGIATSFLTTPLIFGKALRLSKAGMLKIPVIKRLANRKIPTWEEAKLIRKANVYERNEKAVILGKALADKDAKRIAAQLSRQTGKNITPEAVKLRLGQIIKGSITQQEVLAEAANPVIVELSHNFSELQKLGLLGRDTYLTKLTKADITRLNADKQKLLNSLTRLKTEVPYQRKLLEQVSGLAPDAARQQRLAEKLIDVAVKAERRGKKLADMGDEFIDVALDVTTGSPLSQKIAALLDFAPGDKRLTLLGKRILSLEKMGRTARSREADKILKVAAKINPRVSRYTEQTIRDVLKVAEQVEDAKIIGKKPLLKYIQGMSRRFPGRAKKIREMQSQIDIIDEHLRGSTHIGGELYMPRMYTTKEAEIAARKFPVTGAPKVRVPYAKARKKIPVEVRKELGEIIEPSYPVTKRLIQETMDIETAKLFNFAARHGDWVDDVWREGLALKALPDTKAYGALRGKFVTKQIYNDATELSRIRSDFESLYDSIIGSWKIGKVTLSPATHFRNTISNSILLDLSGTDHTAQSRLFIKAIKEIKAGSKEYKTAQKYFARTTMMSGELLDDLLKTVQKEKASGLQKVINTWNRAYEKSTGPAVRQYQREEVIFKFMKYLEQREKGKSIIGAVQEANKWLFDYGDLSRFEKVVARRIMPFYTFPRKALPRVLEAAADRPLALAKYPILAWGLEKYSLSKLELTDKDYAQIQKVLPEYMKRGSYLLMPWRDANGDLQFFDWTYIVPWGELFDVQDRGLAGAVITNPLFQTVADITRNKSGWSGWEIYDETDTPEEKTFKQMLHVWQTAVPSLMYRGIYWDKLYESATGKPSKMGKVRPIGPAIAHTIFGLRAQPIDVTQQQQFRLMEKRGQIAELEGKIRDIIIREASGNIEEKEYNQKRDQYLKQIETVLTEMSDVAAVDVTMPEREETIEAD